MSHVHITRFPSIHCCRHTARTRTSALQMSAGTRFHVRKAQTQTQRIRLHVSEWWDPTSPRHHFHPCTRATIHTCTLHTADRRHQSLCTAASASRLRCFLLHRLAGRRAWAVAAALAEARGRPATGNTRGASHPVSAPELTNRTRTHVRACAHVGTLSCAHVGTLSCVHTHFAMLRGTIWSQRASPQNH